VGSSITYPSYFTANTRAVQMTGEAFFDISHDASKPFLVQRGHTQVAVLGTQFNVNGYEDEKAIKVTLLQGSVEVQRSAGEKLKISPGQQAVIPPESAIRLKEEVDLEEVMAWKNGWFYFNRMGLPEIMRQLEKWYDVEVEYQGSKAPKKFSGMVNRNNNLSEVLKLMEMAGIRFRITPKKIYVMQ
jgi:ferric-dicitrate binding protein FerR (iron transport regulator)